MKIVIVSTFALSTNYSRDLSVSLRKVASPKDVIYLCGKKGESAVDSNPPKVDPVWRPGLLFAFDIFSYVLTKKPQLVHLQQEFKLYGNITSNILFPWLVLLLRLNGTKVVVTIHGVISPKILDTGFLESFNLPQNLLTKILAYLYLFYVYFLTGLFANSLVVLVQSLKDILVKNYLIPAKKIEVIKIGILEPVKKPKQTKINLLKKFPQLVNKEIILVFGYFASRKGYPLLIKSFKKALENNPKAKWVMVLAGNVKEEFVPYKQKIENLIKRLDCSNNIIITGYLEEEEIDQFYRKSKVGVIPTIYTMGTSGALSLALTYLKPVLIASRVEEDNLGLLYNPFVPSSFAKQLESIMTDKKVYQKYYQALVKEAPQRYWSNIARVHYQLYTKLLG